MSDAPLLRNRDIVCLSSIDWQFIWQGHQEIMSALAANGNRVLFVENTGMRRPAIKDLPRLRKRLTNWWRGTKGFRIERPNLFVYSPVILPFPYSRLARMVNRVLMGRALSRWMRAAGFGRPIVWTFLPTPLVREVIHDLDPLVTVYYCIDDLASSSPGAWRITRHEERLFAESDLVFVTSDKLRQRAVKHSDHVHLFPFAVSFAKFDRVREAPGGVPEDLAALPRPVAGYVGGIHQWIDFALLREVAIAMPDVTFALVGPVHADASPLANLPNVHLLGQRPHDDVPKYIKGFDVGLVPYALNEYTANVYPTKLNEYLAMGIPVVATDLPEIRRFNAEHGPAVAVANNAVEYASAVRAALTPSAPDVQTARVSIARQNSWAERIAKMSALIEEVIAARGQERSWEVRLRRLYRSARGRVVLVAGALALVYLAFFETSLPWWMAGPLQRAETPRSADAIVVFAGGVGESGTAGGGYQERVKQAIDLYHAGFATHIVFSSGYVGPFEEAQIMRNLAVQQGQIPPEAIILETKAANTYANVAYTRRILADHQWKSILLVSSPYHMRRAAMTWARIAPEITVVASPVPYSQFYTHDRGATVQQLRGLVQEYVAIAVYWWKGWI